MVTVPTGAVLFNAVADRILAAHLVRTGHSDVMIVRGKSSVGSDVDLVHRDGGKTVRVKVKPDAYFGIDPVKVHDRELPFYRSDVSHYAFEAVADSLTREPGWVFRSDADDLYYYFLTLGQSEEEVRALVAEPDEVFFTELTVERDELCVLPMDAIKDWFGSRFEEYTPRPVAVGDHTAWYRLVPRAHIDGSVPGVRIVGSVFPTSLP